MIEKMTVQTNKFVVYFSTACFEIRYSNELCNIVNQSNNLFRAEKLTYFQSVDDAI